MKVFNYQGYLNYYFLRVLQLFCVKLKISRNFETLSFAFVFEWLREFSELIYIFSVYAWYVATKTYFLVLLWLPQSLIIS